MPIGPCYPVWIRFISGRAGGLGILLAWPSAGTLDYAAAYERSAVTDEFHAISFFQLSGWGRSEKIRPCLSPACGRRVDQRLQVGPRVASSTRNCLFQCEP